MIIWLTLQPMCLTDAFTSILRTTGMPANVSTTTADTSR